MEFNIDIHSNEIAEHTNVPPSPRLRRTRSTCLLGFKLLAPVGNLRIVCKRDRHTSTEGRSSTSLCRTPRIIDYWQRPREQLLGKHGASPEGAEFWLHYAQTKVYPWAGRVSLTHDPGVNLAHSRDVSSIRALERSFCTGQLLRGDSITLVPASRSSSTTSSSDAARRQDERRNCASCHSVMLQRYFLHALTDFDIFTAPLLGSHTVALSCAAAAIMFLVADDTLASFRSASAGSFWSNG